MWMGGSGCGGLWVRCGACAVSLAQSHIRYERAKRATNWALSPDLLVGSKGQVGQKRRRYTTTHRHTHAHTHSGGYLEWQIETGREVRERGTACDQWSSPKRGLVTNNQVNWYVTLHLNAIIAYAPRQPIESTPSPAIPRSTRRSVKWVEVLLLGLRLTCDHLAASRTRNFAGSVGNQARKVGLYGGYMIGRGRRSRKENWGVGEGPDRLSANLWLEFLMSPTDVLIDWLCTQDSTTAVSCWHAKIQFSISSHAPRPLTPPDVCQRQRKSAKSYPNSTEVDATTVAIL